MRDGTLGEAEGVLVRMARVMMHAFRRHDVVWTRWHLRTWRNARDAIARAWGHHPAASVTALSVGGVRVVAARSATSCSDVSHPLVGGRPSACGAGAIGGGARLRWEGRWSFIAGESWQTKAETWDPQACGPPRCSCSWQVVSSMAATLFRALCLRAPRAPLAGAACSRHAPTEDGT